MVEGENDLHTCAWNACTHQDTQAHRLTKNVKEKKEQQQKSQSKSKTKSRVSDNMGERKLLSRHFCVKQLTLTWQVSVAGFLS